jgi:peptidoglycan/xylan/chitin deacetylase (PgdA/CDA1 family)
MCNIIALHRIQVDNHKGIIDLYNQRNMVKRIDWLNEFIENQFKNHKLPGSILECLQDDKYFHLSFDDGFKEHFQVAVLLKEKYNLPYNSVSFSISVSNSIKHTFTGMDIIYNILEDNRIGKLNQFLETNFSEKNISEIKTLIANLEPERLKDFSDYFSEYREQLKNTFLSKLEIVELSKLFQISSHGITHRYLINHKKESEKEISQSKVILEKLINKKIDTFCYPEGKNDADLQEFCKKAGYINALSIRHEENNKYCIGRKIT